MRITGSRTYYRPSPPKMPPGLVELMEGLTREVLKQNPSNIYEFCANHVQQLLEKRDGPSNKKLSLEEKIARVQHKVRQRAEIRKKEFDKIFLQEHSHAETSNVVNDDEINISSMLPISRSVDKDSNKVDFERTKHTIDTQDQISESYLKAPVHHESELENLSEVEVFQKSGLDFITPAEAYDVDTSSSQVNEVNVDSSLPDSKVEYEISDNLHEGHLGSTDNKGSLFIPIEKQTSANNISSKEVLVSEREESNSSVAQIQNTSTDKEKVSVSELDVKNDIVKDASIIIDELYPKEIYVTEKENSIAPMSQIQNSNQNSSIDGEKSGLPKFANIMEDATITINYLDPKEVDVTKKETSIASMTRIQNVEHSGENKENLNVVNDDVLKIDEANILNMTGTEKTKSDLETGNNDNDIPDTIDIQIGQKEESKEDMQEGASDGSQTDENIREVNYNTISVKLENKVAPSFEKLAPLNSVINSYEEDNVISESLALKNKPSYQDNTHAEEDYSSSTSKEPEIKLINTPSNITPAVKTSNIVADSNIENPLKEHIYLDSIEPNSGMKINTAYNELDIKKIANSDTPVLISGISMNYKNQINETTRAASAINDDKNLPDERNLRDISFVEISSERDFNVDTLDEDQNVENRPTDILTNSDSGPINTPGVKNYNNSEINSSLPIDHNSERDNFNNNGMDLETAAITIQKVFRNFLFKSRGSTLEDTVNDDTMFMDEDNKEVSERNFPVENISTKNLDRRPHGITRMDTVLQTVNEEKSLSLSTDDSSTLSSAATIIQAHVRGFLVRNKLNSNKTNSSLVASNSNDLPITPLDAGNNQQGKTVLNIHIVPESGDDLSRDESLITSMDLSLDSPSTTNLHPLNDNKSDRRKRLKREDAIQSVSPPSNNSGKLSDENDSVKEIVADSLINENNSIKTEWCYPEDRNVSKELSTLQTFEVINDNFKNTVDSTKNSVENIDNELKLNQKSKSLTKMNSDERDVVTPFTSNDDSGLVHSGEFHDAVVPTKVSRSDTPVVREFKDVLVYFLLWNHS